MRIIVGTKEYLAAMQKDIAWEQITDEQGMPRWEGLLHQTADSRLILAGNDRRGAVYAVYRFCERIGVSAWWDMADVPVSQKEQIVIEDNYFLADWPSVRYRGIFLNDEEELDAWTFTNGLEHTIGPVVYEKIFELILRLGGNLIWPAMHVNAFNLDPENGALAERMGIVTGTSHCDMLHRSNQNEWKVWKKQKGYTDTAYDYTIPGKNREQLLEYWRESLEQNQTYEACYTIGMRGIHDSGFVTKNLSDESLSEEEKMQQKKRLLEEIMEAQRTLIKKIHPDKQIPQSFVPYKEVLPIYDSGLQVPEDVMLIWVDDNHGYVRRYPNPEEQKRSGGHGLYYHSSYWAPPGMSWLFLCSTPLAHMGNELKKCYEQNIRQLWVDNVGALKPIELDMEYFLRCGWDAGREHAAFSHPKQFLCEWMNRNFSGNHGEAVAEFYTEFAQLANLCKPEHMRSDIFTQTVMGDEAGGRVNRLYKLQLQAQRIYEALPENEKTAFFELILMKMKATFYIAASYYYADRSRAAFRIGAMPSADWNLTRSRELDDLKRMLLYYYNEIMADGKWRNILTPEDFPPPTLELYPACQPALLIEQGEILLRLPEFGQKEGLCFDINGVKKQWFELFTSGSGELTYYLKASEGIHIDSWEGSISCKKGITEVRHIVWVDETFESGEITICTQEKLLRIPVSQDIRPMHTALEPERDGTISLNASHVKKSCGFQRIEEIGRGNGDVLESNAKTNEETPSCLEYQFETKTKGAATLEIIRFLTLNSKGRIRMKVYLDEKELGVLESKTIDEYLGNWEQAAVLNGEKLTAEIALVETGVHTLRVEALDPYVTISQVNLYLKGYRNRMMGLRLFEEAEPLLSFDCEKEQQFFGLSSEDVPPPYEVICDETFWTQDMLYARNRRIRPENKKTAINWTKPDGSKNVLETLKQFGPVVSKNEIKIDTMSALTQSNQAWMTTGKHDVALEHRQAESYGRTGLAIWRASSEKQTNIIQDAAIDTISAMHFKINIEKSDRYCLWLHAKYDDFYHFGCRYAIDGIPVAEMTDICRERFHTYRSVYMWCWQSVAEIPLEQGEHTLTLAITSPKTAIDEILLVRKNEIPSFAL